MQRSQIWPTKKFGTDRCLVTEYSPIDEALYRPIVVSVGCHRHICGRNNIRRPTKSGPNLDDTCTDCEIVNHVINCVQLLRCQFASFLFGRKGAPSARAGGLRMMINAPLME